MAENLGIIKEMKSLGFSEYEIKAYLSLLEKNPLNGYTLSKESGIPRSRIYEVLDSLKNKQIVFEQNDGKTSIYYPLEPKMLITKLEKNFSETIKNVDTYINELYVKKENENKLIVLKGRKNIIDSLKILISEAKTRIALSIWEEEIVEIQEELSKAIERGVIVRGIYFGVNNIFKDLVPHRDIETYLLEKKERYMTVTIDGKDVLYGVISRGEDSQITWSKDAAFIDISEDYICHDLMVNLYYYKLDKEQEKEYDEFMDNVRHDYFCYSEEEKK